MSVVNLTSFFSDVHATDPGGDFLFRLQPNEQFEVMVEKPGYFSMSMAVNTAGMKRGVIELGDAKGVELEPVQIGEGARFAAARIDDDEPRLFPKHGCDPNRREPRTREREHPGAAAEVAARGIVMQGEIRVGGDAPQSEGREQMQLQ